MKTYCKPATVNVEDWKFNEIAVIECFRNKRGRNDSEKEIPRQGCSNQRRCNESLSIGNGGYRDGDVEKRHRQK